VFDQTVQLFISKDLDRDFDEGVHAYIQYNENRQTVWMQGALLTAYYYGDVVCMDGGVEAYKADEESAILFVCKENNLDVITELQESEIVRDENYYLIAFEK